MTQGMLNWLTIDAMNLAKQATYTAEFAHSCRREKLKKLRHDHSQEVKDEIENFWKAAKFLEKDATAYWEAARRLMEIEKI